MTNPDPALSERYRFIDFLLLFKGRLTRAELVKRFAIGEATASRTIASYIDSHPDLIELQSNKKGYYAKNGFTPEYSHSALAGLKYIASGELTKKIDVDCYGIKAHHLHRVLDAKIVAAITRAIVNRYIAAIEYLSTTSGRKTRSVTPHAIFESSGSWYFRAYDSFSREFRTFKFSRLVSVIDLSAAENPKHSKSKDAAWHQMRLVRLIPHPKNPNPDTQAFDPGEKNAEVKELMVSEACLGFVLTDLRVDCSKYHRLSFYEYPLALQNRDELEDIKSMELSPGF
ncbi:helix-turn-helix transcriptional regulator [Endozoicomonas euniceicola]|uniref:WYL domain-containing protein n=1 Tax=Endozoicomonas euniceicola TaxID=1234143 RepID=A0ABY6GXY9_9GAMM|nr:WYL domain-containing protein [Endozoicomonas euniceicola]UYM17637.1 WYL domain-containing protein [Endozoicomonas euniceicola]